MAFEDALDRLTISIDALAKSVAALKQGAAEDTSEAPPAEAPRPRGRPRAVPSAPAAPAAPAPAAAPKAPSIGYDDVRSVVLEIAEKQGHGAAMAVLGKFGVDHASKLKPEQYADFVSAGQTALKGAASLA